VLFHFKKKFSRLKTGRAKKDEWELREMKKGIIHINYFLRPTSHKIF
jgi:hypothetical protein